jgi:alkylhydroperoxidase/carboxymuconolactone decarboxylase family protein YurZ
MIRMVRANPRLGKTLGAHYGEVMFGPGTLDRREREMIAAVASAAQDCTY